MRSFCFALITRAVLLTALVLFNGSPVPVPIEVDFGHVQHIRKHPRKSFPAGNSESLADVNLAAKVG